MELGDEIILKLHPYDARNYMVAARSNKLLLYRMLQRWCFPYLDVLYLRRRIPSLTLSQLIDVSLYYYPIEASIGKYSWLELFRRAAKNRQLEPEKFIQWDANELDLITVVFIANRYNVINVLQLMSIIDEYFAPSSLAKFFLEGTIDQSLFKPIHINHIITQGYARTIDILDVLNALHVNSFFMGLSGHINNRQYNDAGIIMGANIKQEIVRKYIASYNAMDRAEYFKQLVRRNAVDGVTGSGSLLYRLPILRILAELALEGYDDNNPTITRIKYTLSAYNSKEYPTSDIYLDIMSGNYLEVLVKLGLYPLHNTIKRLDSRTPTGYGNTRSGISHDMNTASVNFPQLERYKQARYNTISYTYYLVHPAVADIVLQSHLLELTDKYIVNTKHLWCPISTIPTYDQYKVLSLYYNPIATTNTNIDGAILIYRAGKLEYNWYRCLPYVKLLRSSASSIAALLACYIYNYRELIEKFTSRYADAILLRDILLGRRAPGIPGDALILSIVNNYYITPDSILDIVGRFSLLPLELIEGLQGQVTNGMMNLIGLCLNSYCTDSILLDVLNVFGLSLITRLTREQLNRLIIPNMPNIPTALLIQTSDIVEIAYNGNEELQQMISNIDSRLVTVSTTESAVNNGDYNSLLSKSLYSDNKQYISALGYKLTSILQ